MEMAPDSIDIPSLRTSILNLKGVTAVPVLYVWALTPGDVIAACSIEVDDSLTDPQVLDAMKSVRDALKAHGASKVFVDIGQVTGRHNSMPLAIKPTLSPRQRRNSNRQPVTRSATSLAEPR